MEDMVSTIKTDKFLILNTDPPMFFEQIYKESALDLWADMYWDLYFQNRVFAFAPISISINLEEKIISAKLKNSEKIKISFTKGIEVSSTNLIDVTGASISLSSKGVCVMDLFEVNQGSEHDKWVLQTDDSLVNEVRFFITDRIDGNTKKKDFVSYSFLGKDDLREFGFSDTMVKFKVEDLLNQSLELDKPVKIKHIVRHFKGCEEFSISSHSPLLLRKKRKNTITKSEYARIKSKYTRKKK